MCKKECGEKGTTIKPDGGGIKHAENSQTIDKRIQFSGKIWFYHRAPQIVQSSSAASVLGDTLEAQQTSQWEAVARVGSAALKQ